MRGGKASQDKSKPTPEQERQRRLANRDVKLIKHATKDQGESYVAAFNARDFDTAESILDAIEAGEVGT